MKLHRELVAACPAFALVELAYFLDTFHDSPPEVERLFEEGAQKALKTELAVTDGLLPPEQS